jgi:hypothetical protein
MKKLIILFCLSLLFAPAMIRAQGPMNKPFGLGLTLGEPAGITGKVWLDHKNALDFALGWGYYPYHGVALYCDYVHSFFSLLPAGKYPAFELTFYAGIGGKIGGWHYHHDGDQDGFGLGVRVPVGLTMVFNKAPFDIFLEITPCLEFISPDPFWFDFDAAVGARFYF